MSKRICVTSFGSLGDIHPYVAVARRLQERGHDVVFATLDRFSAHVEQAGLRFASLEIDWDEARFDRMMQEVIAAKNPLRQGQIIFSHTADAMVTGGRALDRIVSDCDMVFTHLYQLGGFTAATKARKPFATGHLITAMMRSRGASPIQRDLGPWLNRVRQWLFDYAVASQTDKPVNAVLQQLGVSHCIHALRHALHSPKLNVVAVSPTVRPRDPGWADHYRLTGAWRVPELDTPLPLDLEQFLTAGLPPVFVTLGSTQGMDTTKLKHALISGAAQAKIRLILQAGWAGLDVTPSENVFLLRGFVPYASLLPRVHGVLHHGGAGTSAECFHTGVPTGVIWSLADQQAWGALAVKLGLCSGEAHYRHITSEWVARTVQAMPQLSVTCAAFAARLNQEEDGATQAAKLIEREFM